MLFLSKLTVNPGWKKNYLYHRASTLPLLSRLLITPTWQEQNQIMLIWPEIDICSTICQFVRDRYDDAALKDTSFGTGFFFFLSIWNVVQQIFKYWIKDFFSLSSIAF